MKQANFTKLLLAMILLICNAGVHAQWTISETPSSYHLYGIDAVTNVVIYAGGYGGSLVKSIDGGETWNALSIGSFDWVKSIHFFNADNGWIITSNSMGDGGDVLKTTDGGVTWTSSHSGYAYSDMHWIDDQICYVSTWQGVLVKTTNAGVSWVVLPTPYLDVNVYSIQFFDEDNGFALNTDYKLLRTDDGGATWTNTYHAGLLNFFFMTPTTGFCVNDYGEIGKTTDGGLTYEYISTDFEGIKFNDIEFLTEDFGYAIGGLDCRDGSCLQSPVLLSTKNGGETWESNAHPLEGQLRGFYELSFAPNGTPFIAGSNKMVLKNTSFVGLPETDEVQYINAFPNPSNGVFTFNFSSSVEKIKIRNILGEVVEIIETNHQHTIQISLFDYSAGLYLVEFQNQHGTVVGNSKVQLN